MGKKIEAPGDEEVFKQKIEDFRLLTDQMKADMLEEYRRYVSQGIDPRTAYNFVRNSIVTEGLKSAHF